MLKANIGLELIAGHDELEKFMEGILQGRTEDELKRQAGILGKTVRNNAQKANAIVNASFHNAKFSDRIWMYQDLLRADVGKLLQSGLIAGKNPRVLARELRKTFDTSVCNSERLMRTELARVQTEAQKQSFERNGFDMYEFITNSGCCDICQGLNGKHFKVEKMKPGENAPPMHPNCRCSVAALTNQERVWCMSGSGKAQILKQMAAWGNGARAEVFVAFTGGMTGARGHVFVAEQRDGKTYFIDPQTGDAECSRYFKDAMKGRTFILRIDNNWPSDAIMDCCGNWGENK